MLSISKNKFWLSLVVCFLSSQLLWGKVIFTPNIIEKSKKSVVTIQANISFAAYSNQKDWSGTGCIVDKKNGYILTNKHVIGTAAVGTYKVIFYNGIQKEATMIYYDPWLDYGYLKIDPTNIPKEVTELKFSKKNPVIDQPIFMVGNNGGFSFSLHTGVVADLYSILGYMPQQSIKLNLNSAGGSSGSPIFNKEGEAIGLNYAGNQTFGLALHPEYIRYSLEYIQNRKLPVRKQIGVITKSESLSDLVQYHGLSPLIQQEYIKTFPDGANNAIQIKSILPNSPASGLILPGDLIWAIDGQQIGPILVRFDMAMNKSLKDYVILTVFRNGLWHDVKVGLYKFRKS